MAIIGEVGLTGEVRNVAMAEKRIIEAEKMGFKKVILPLVTYNKLEKKEKYKRRFKGIVFETVFTRNYVQSEAFQETLGFVNNENKGVYGIEKYYDKEMKGQDGIENVEVDAKGNTIRRLENTMMNNLLEKWELSQDLEYQSHF